MKTDHPKREAVVEAEGAAVAGGASNAAVLEKLKDLYLEAFAHDGFAGIQVEIRFLRRGQKEVILHCGKQYRFIVDYPPEAGRRQKQAGGKSGQAERAENARSAMNT
ncbi:MAG: hypothetical protein LBJ59_11510 [Zoogloeaceae bacterium]|jgi:hypothetical protein|nr:hypothetical protein [Zoogloeaceae bacterium]